MKTPLSLPNPKSAFFRLSQGHLNLLELCPPQFQRIYLEQLTLPTSVPQQERLAWGSQFHQLMQQQELGIPIDSLLTVDEEFKQAILALKRAAPELWQSSPNIIFREAEHYRSLTFNGYLLTVVYDLLILKQSAANIVDWKTYLEPENPTKLARNWQTRLYLYLLAETESEKYRPEQISMTYWFVKLPHHPQSITFKYDQNQHQKNKEDLNSLLTKLANWLDRYAENNDNFPHLDNCQSNCEYYKYFVSEASIENKNQENWLTNLEEIEEIPFNS